MTGVPRPQDSEWSYLLSLLPKDLEESARRTRALVRCRNVASASALIQMALAYAVSDLSLKDVAAWARSEGLAEITGPGLFYRLREAQSWLEEVLARTLSDEVVSSPCERRLRLVDATVLTGPGAKGTEWRAHATVDPVTGKLSSVELTDAHGGEGLGRHALRSGEVLLGDCAYATARGLDWVSRAGAAAVVRLNPHTLRLCGQDRQRVTLRGDMVPEMGEKTFDLLVPIPPEGWHKSKSHKPWPLQKASAWIPVRVVAARTSKGQALWVLDTLPKDQVSPTQVLELYRVRWQVELVFKRLKSLLHLDALPSRQGPTARTWILARLLAAALAQKLLDPAGALSPWGYNVGNLTPHPQRMVQIPNESLGTPGRHSRKGALADRPHQDPR
jgi:Transposase DDE domain